MGTLKELHKEKHIIEVELGDHPSVAKISFAEDGTAELTECTIEHHKEVLTKVLNSLKGLKLSIPVSSPVEKNKDGRPVIRDKVKYCSQGDPDYVYALAHELSHHTCEGLPFRGIVRDEKAGSLGHE